MLVGIPSKSDATSFQVLLLKYFQLCPLSTEIENSVSYDASHPTFLIIPLSMFWELNWIIWGSGGVPVTTKPSASCLLLFTYQHKISGLVKPVSKDNEGMLLTPEVKNTFE